MQLKNSTQPLKENKIWYQLLKPSRNSRISCWVTMVHHNLYRPWKQYLQWVKSFRPHFALPFTPWRIWSKFEYLPGKNAVANSLSHLDIESLKIQEGTEEALTLLTQSENSSISNVKLSIPLHNALIFKEQTKAKESGLSEKGLASPSSLLNTIYWKIRSALLQRQQSRSTFLNHREISKEHCPGTMNTLQTRIEKAIRNTMTWPSLTQDVDHWLLISHCRVCQMTKKELPARNMVCSRPK
jgi:hypothetical protein